MIHHRRGDGSRLPRIFEAAALRDAVRGNGELPDLPPHLYELRAEGWVAAEREPLRGPDDWRPVTRFRITDEGRAALVRFLDTLAANGFGPPPPIGPETLGNDTFGRLRDVAQALVDQLEGAGPPP